MSRKGLTELVMIIDRSGSMSGLESDTIGGFNSLVEKQRKEDGQALLSVVLFNEEAKVIYDRADLRKVRPLTEKQYAVGGCTALLDAVGGAIRHIGYIHKYAREEDVPEKTVFVITTDGLENSSREFTYEAVRKMIERQQKRHHWEFLFLGANMDAVAEAARFGLNESRAARYEQDAEGTALTFSVISDACSSARKACNAEAMNVVFESRDLLDKIRIDRKKRGGRTPGREKS